eukprot:COSAG01_NODE_20405_length_955_cov_2.442757_1_plen_62_part_10
MVAGGVKTVVTLFHQYNSTTYGSVYRCTTCTVVLPSPLLVMRPPGLTDFTQRIPFLHFMRIF